MTLYRHLLTPMDWQIEALRYAADKAGADDVAYRRAMVEARRYEMFNQYMHDIEIEMIRLRSLIRELEGERK